MIYSDADVLRFVEECSGTWAAFCALWVLIGRLCVSKVTKEI